MFWIGCVVGFFVGGTVGILVAALMSVAGQADRVVAERRSA